jgi:hypothetical protein
MKFNEAFPNSKRTLKGSDLEDGEVIIGVVSHVEMRVIGRDASNNLPVLVFSNDTTPMIINETQWRALDKAFGNDTRDWAGQSIELRGKDGVNRKGEPYRTIEITPCTARPEEERQAAIEAAAEAENEAKEAAAAAAKATKAKRPKLAMDIDLNDEVPY